MVSSEGFAYRMMQPQKLNHLKRLKIGLDFLQRTMQNLKSPTKNAKCMIMKKAIAN